MNAATGKVTALTYGVTNIVGTSPFGSEHGQLTLILYVGDGAFPEISMIALWGDISCHTDGFTHVQNFAEELEIELEDRRIYGLEQPSERMTPGMFAICIANSRIFYFRGHGNKIHVQIDINGNTTTNFDISYINSLPTDAFSRCELLIYSACSTAEGGENATNLVAATRNHGAETVVGFTIPVKTAELNYWDQFFFEALGQGRTVDNAREYAREKIAKMQDPALTNTYGQYGSANVIVAGNKANIIS